MDRMTRGAGLGTQIATHPLAALGLAVLAWLPGCQLAKELGGKVTQGLLHEPEVEAATAEGFRADSYQSLALLVYVPHNMNDLDAASVEEPFTQQLNSKHYQVSNRTDAAEIMKDHEWNLSDVVDSDQKAADLGRALKRDAILVARVTEAKSRSRRIKGQQGNQIEVIATVSARLIDLGKNQVVWSGKANLTQGDSDSVANIVAKTADALAREFPERSSMTAESSH